MVRLDSASDPVVDWDNAQVAAPTCLRVDSRGLRKVSSTTSSVSTVLRPVFDLAVEPLETFCRTDPRLVPHRLPVSVTGLQRCQAAQALGPELVIGPVLVIGRVHVHLARVLGIGLASAIDPAHCPNDPAKDLATDPVLAHPAQDLGTVPAQDLATVLAQGPAIDLVLSQVIVLAIAHPEPVLVIDPERGRQEHDLPALAHLERDLPALAHRALDHRDITPAFVHPEHVLRAGVHPEHVRQAGVHLDTARRSTCPTTVGTIVRGVGDGDAIVAIGGSGQRPSRSPVG